MIHQDTEIDHHGVGQVKAFVPSSVTSAFSLLPEAKNLALLDGVAGASETSRRPEAFYRFLMQFLDKELAQLISSTASADTTADNATQSQGSIIDNMQGISFLCINEYTTGSAKPTTSTSRALTVDLAYDQFIGHKKGDSIDVRFGDILRFSLCKEVPLRAWCKESSSYESVPSDATE